MRSLRLLLCGSLVAAAGCGRTKVVSLDPEASAQPPAAEVVVSANTPDPDLTPSPGGAFTFPDDRGGRLLAALLPPAEPARLPPDPAAGPRPRRAPESLEQPDLPLPPVAARLPGAPLPKPVDLRPRALADGTPFENFRAAPAPPQSPELPPGALARLPSLDVSSPVPLPPLAKPVTDRPPLDDPTADFSAASVTARAPRMRAAPAPFARVDLPDPFANADPALRRPPSEDAPPLTRTPQTPRR
jgi:hypothetical protein